MTEQSFVVKKFFISLVAHARNAFVEANKEADAWLKELVNPLVGQIQEMRNSTERHRSDPVSTIWRSAIGMARSRSIRAPGMPEPPKPTVFSAMSRAMP